MYIVMKLILEFWVPFLKWKEMIEDIYLSRPVLIPYLTYNIGRLEIHMIPGHNYNLCH